MIIVIVIISFFIYKKNYSALINDKDGFMPCADSPVNMKDGRYVYPINPEYRDLEFLGQIFTAHDCGPERVKKIFGVEGDNYRLGLTVWLKNNPPSDLIKIFDDLGLKCIDKKTGDKCRIWQTDQNLKVDDLMRLAPYYGIFKMDDCVNCR